MEIWLPSSVAERRKVGVCKVCKTPFFHGDNIPAHIAKCFTRNEARLWEENPKRKIPFIYDKMQWDHEYEDHLRDKWKREGIGRYRHTPDA